MGTEIVNQIQETQSPERVTDRKVSTTNWHLPRALPISEQQRHFPSASMETEPHVLQLLTFNNPQGSSGWIEALCGPGNLEGQVFRSLDVFRNRYYDLNPSISSYLEKHFRLKDTYRLKVKGWKNIFHANGNQKNFRVAILISDKIDLKIKKITRDKEGYYIMIKGSIQEEDKQLLIYMHST